MARHLLCLAVLCASLTPATSAAGLRLQLNHVDANANLTVEDRMSRATDRTLRSLASMGGVAAPFYWERSQYIAEYHIGEPPQRAEAIVDSGSNLIWTQCPACRPRCFRQNLPYYDPSLSLTARAMACHDAACALGSETRCTAAGTPAACVVRTGYGAGAIAGVLGVEAFTFLPETTTVTLAFGCITAPELSPGSLDGASGIIGLGRGKLSLVSQIGDTKFSYCLTPYYRDTIAPSYLLVGASAGLSGNGAPVTSVPFLENPDEAPFSTFYYLPLERITMGGATLDVPAAAFDLRQVAPGAWAGTFIDSGTPFTSLVGVAYRALREELARQLGGALVRSPAQGLDLCVARRDAGEIPPMVLRFGRGGGDLLVPPENYWAPVDTATVCMVVFSSASPDGRLPMNETTVIGNFMQQDMHLLYDLGNGVLSFQPADCSSM